MKQTVLYSEHVRLGARMAPFGGFDMPIQYSGILAEHEATRSAGAVFDTCHMGEFRLRGRGALALLERLLSCDVAGLAPGRCRYGFLCNEAGGVIDDQIVYCFGPEDYMMVVNAGTREKDFAWVSGHASSAVEVTDVSEETGKIDIQGPGSPVLISRLLDNGLPELKYFHFSRASFAGTEILLSRTGYTGEIGFEIYAPAEEIVRIWRRALELGAVPAGLGARDTLRLEMGYPLYGHELSEDRNAAESGLDFAISAGKDFIGAARVRAPDAVRERLVGILLAGRRAARAGAGVFAGTETRVGTVTSGSFGPSLKQAVALAYVAREQAAPGRSVQVRVGRNLLDGEIVSLPFYRSGTARKALRRFLAGAEPAGSVSGPGRGPGWSLEQNPMNSKENGE